jgi:hypothetical protein
MKMFCGVVLIAAVLGPALYAGLVRSGTVAALKPSCEATPRPAFKTS